MLPRSQRSNRGRNVPFYVRHRLTTAFLTRSRRSQARKPRAARICGPVITATADEPEAVALDFICPLPPDGTARASSAGRGVPRPPPGFGCHLRNLEWVPPQNGGLSKRSCSPERISRSALQVSGSDSVRLRRAASSAPASAMSLRNSGEL
jgi:hypothetical protein